MMNMLTDIIAKEKKLIFENSTWPPSPSSLRREESVGLYRMVISCCGVHVTADRSSPRVSDITTILAS